MQQQATIRLNLNSFVEGDGYPVILVHDWAASMRDWDALTPLLVTGGHRVYACDLFGHGHSPTPPDPNLYYAQMFVATFRRWIDGIDLEFSPILIGHGFGAYLTLRYAIGHPYKVSKLILINPLCAPDQFHRINYELSHRPWLLKLARRYFPEWTTRQLLGLTPELDETVQGHVMENYRLASPFILRLPATVADLSNELRDLPTRSLLLATEHDPLFDLSPLPGLVEEMPDAVFQQLPFPGHRPHLLRPEETNQAIINFLVGM